jgi:hypothetical protein
LQLVKGYLIELFNLLNGNKLENEDLKVKKKDHNCYKIEKDYRNIWSLYKNLSERVGDRNLE